MIYSSLPSAKQAKEIIERNAEKLIIETLERFLAQIRGTVRNSVAELVDPCIANRIVKIFEEKGYKVHIDSNEGPGLDFTKITIYW